MKLSHANDAINSSLHDSVDAVETFAKASGDAGDVPTQTKGGFLVRGTAELETESSCDSRRMGN
jgi:hypothetical protein